MLLCDVQQRWPNARAFAVVGCKPKGKPATTMITDQPSAITPTEGCARVDWVTRVLQQWQLVACAPSLVHARPQAPQRLGPAGQQLLVVGELEHPHKGLHKHRVEHTKLESLLIKEVGSISCSWSTGARHRAILEPTSWYECLMIEQRWDKEHTYNAGLASHLGTILGGRHCMHVPAHALTM